MNNPWYSYEISQNNGRYYYAAPVQQSASPCVGGACPLVRNRTRAQPIAQQFATSVILKLSIKLKFP